MNIQRPPTTIQVCVIGNSYSGAMKKAYQSGRITTDPYRFFFFASAGPSFENVKIVDGQITNADYFDVAASKRVDDYGAVVIYGDLPLPSEVSAIFNRLPPDKYSIAVRRLCLLDWLFNFTAYKLASTLVTRRIPKVLVLSRNYNVLEKLGARSESTDSVILMRKMIQPASYIPAPDLLFSDEGTPRADFYNGSLNILGDEPDRALQPLHHHHHHNLFGGEVMLAAVVDYLRSE